MRPPIIEFSAQVYAELDKCVLVSRRLEPKQYAVWLPKRLLHRYLSSHDGETAVFCAPEVLLREKGLIR